jgi:hypothetical protein
MFYVGSNERNGICGHVRRDQGMGAIKRNGQSSLGKAFNSGRCLQGDRTVRS